MNLPVRESFGGTRSGRWIRRYRRAHDLHRAVDFQETWIWQSLHVLMVFGFPRLPAHERQRSAAPLVLDPQSSQRSLALPVLSLLILILAVWHSRQ